jgi:DNA sulfur modification protein DndC
MIEKRLTLFDCRPEEGVSVSLETLAEQVDQITAEMREAYLGDDRPWVVGFSGGKDSTVVVQLTYYMLLGLTPPQRHKKVYVLASDTRVELPTIVERVDHQLELIRHAATRDGLPIEAHKVFPSLNDSFWLNLIGRGYPSPRPKFRWCTDRLKIRPVSRFILDRVSDFGSVIVVLGSRMSESSTRAQIMAAHHIDGQRFRPHADLPKAWVYTPIENLTTDDVWFYLLQSPSPWGGDNATLAALYKRASGGECPLVIDTSTPSCGNSRFGCWVCTVVEKDRAMESLVEDGEERYQAMLELRDFLKEVREVPEARMNTRRNGRPAAADGKGPFTHRTRIEILSRLLEAEKSAGGALIDSDELAAIAEIWATEGLDRGLVFKVWRHVYEGEDMPKVDDESLLSEEDKLLDQVCKESGLQLEMLLKLRDIEEAFGTLRRRHGLPEEMRDAVRSYVEKS